MTETLQEQPNRDQLKVMALRQRIAEIVADYEDRDAERRITITEASQKIEELEAALTEIRTAAEAEDVQEEE